MTTKTVKPVGGASVSDPYGRIVPADGAIVPWNSYWKRRVAEGNLEVVQPRKARKTTKATKQEDEG